jgi:hypothetical protein
MNLYNVRRSQAALIHVIYDRLRVSSHLVAHEVVSQLSHLRKNGPFYEFSLCLSRACVVKMFVCIYEWLEKTVFTHLHSRAIVQAILPNNATTHPFVLTFPIYVCPEPVLVK